MARVILACRSVCLLVSLSARLSVCLSLQPRRPCHIHLHNLLSVTIRVWFNPFRSIVLLYCHCRSTTSTDTGFHYALLLGGTPPTAIITQNLLHPTANKIRPRTHFVGQYNSIVTRYGIIRHFHQVQLHQLRGAEEQCLHLRLIHGLVTTLFFYTFSDQRTGGGWMWQTLLPLDDESDVVSIFINERHCLGDSSSLHHHLRGPQSKLYKH